MMNVPLFQIIISSINIFSTKYLVVVYSRSILEYLVAPIIFFPKKKEEGPRMWLLYSISMM